MALLLSQDSYFSRKKQCVNLFLHIIHKSPVPSSSSAYIVLPSAAASHYGAPKAKASAMFPAHKHRIAHRGASTRV